MRSRAGHGQASHHGPWRHPTQPAWRPAPPPQALSDDNKRAIYDRYGEAGLKGGAGGFGGAGQGDFSSPFDIFESFFGGGLGGMGGGTGGGGGRQRSRATTGEDERCARARGRGGAGRAAGREARSRGCAGHAARCAKLCCTQQQPVAQRTRMAQPVHGPHWLALLLPRRYDLQLDFLEAVFGASKEIDVDRLATCSVSCTGWVAAGCAATAAAGRTPTCRCTAAQCSMPHMRPTVCPPARAASRRRARGRAPRRAPQCPPARSAEGGGRWSAPCARPWACSSRSPRARGVRAQGRSSLRATRAAGTGGCGSPSASRCG